VDSGKMESSIKNELCKIIGIEFQIGVKFCKAISVNGYFININNIFDILCGAQ
jgi:hypothetical protein